MKHCWITIAGWCALLLYVATFSPAGFATAAFAGSLDRSHHCCLRDGKQGFQLVLQHTRVRAPHHHGLVARALTAFARPDSAANPDHVIQFDATDNVAQQTQLTKPSPKNSSDMELIVVEVSPSSLRYSFASANLPAPGESTELLGRRAVVLLI